MPATQFFSTPVGSGTPNTQVFTIPVGLGTEKIQVAVNIGGSVEMETRVFGVPVWSKRASPRRKRVDRESDGHFFGLRPSCAPDLNRNKLVATGLPLLSLDSRVLILVPSLTHPPP